MSLLNNITKKKKSEIFRHKTSHMVLSIIFLEDKHTILLHLSIFYEYQHFFQHCICFLIQPPDYSDPWPRLARSSNFFLVMLFNKCNKIVCLSSRNMIDKTICEVLWRNISDFYVNLRVEVPAVSRNRYNVEQTVDTHKILINAMKFYVCLQEIW
jgi:hypothetical protein